MRGPRYRSKLPYYNGRPDLTPLVDVLFLLLIFFMLSSSFVQVSGVPVTLPRTDAPGSANIEKYIVSIMHSDKGDLIYFNDRPVNEETLKQDFAEVRMLSRSATVILRADAGASFESVAKILSLAKRAELNTFIAVMSSRSGEASPLKGPSR